MKKLISTLVLANFIFLLAGQIPSTGLVAYYPFNGNANDVSGNGHNGTVNGATLTADRFGNTNSAYSFDGLLNYITGTIGNQTVISLSLWYNSVYPINWYPQIFRVDNVEFLSMAGNHAAFINNKNVGHIGGYPDPINSIPYIPSFNQWHHVVISHDNSVGKHTIYIDNILYNTVKTTGNIPAVSGVIYLGNTSNGYTSDGKAGFKGVLDDIRIFNRALTSTEISSLYNESICKTSTSVTDTLFIKANLTGFNPMSYQNTIKVYPNPTKDAITIDCGVNFSTIGTYKIKISNSLGQTVYQSLITQQKTTINLNSWTGKGMYIVELIDSNSNTIENKKIVLQ